MSFQVDFQETGNTKTKTKVILRSVSETCSRLKITKRLSIHFLKTLTIEEGDPFGIACAAPDGWPKPKILWMLEGQNSLKTVNSSRLTVDPAGKLWFSNVTFDDMSDNFLYACSAASYFRNEYKLGNRVHLHVIPRTSR